MTRTNTTPGVFRLKFFRRLLAVLTSVAMVVVGLTAAPASFADEPEIDLPETVSADIIASPQLNGVAWDLRVRGNIAYVVGSFTRARPSGVAAGGAGEVVRNNGMAFNISTGQILSWNPNFNAPVMDIEFSPDGSRFFVGGQFTAAGGQAKSKIAEFDTSSGAMTSFATSVGGSVESVAVTNDALYLVGSFGSVAGQERRNVAKLSRSNAQLQGWNPIVDDIVHGIIATDSSDRVIIGGRFQTINGATKVGVGAVHKDTGEQMAWNSAPIPARIAAGQRAWVVDMKLENGVIYAANNGEGWHWFDGRWAADFETGDLTWLDNCYGSTSSISVMGDVAYSTPHAHDCSSVEGFPEESPMIWRRALAETTFATGTDKTPPSNNSLVRNQPIPTLLHWYPSVNTGFYTGQYQGGWAMDNNGDYLVMGGEFTRLNNENQQGLAVFPKRSLSPNAMRPIYTADLKPSVVSQGSGTVRVAWPTTWDYDDENLKYEVLRDNSMTPLDTQEVSSIWWKQTSLGFRDTSAQAGSTHTYRIRVSDPWGNNYIGPRSEPVTVGNTPQSPYTEALRDAGANIYYPLNEPSGNVAFDNLGFVDGDASSALTRGVDGAISGDAASGFSGQTLASRNMIEGPNTFSTQLWFKTDTTQGGKLIGFGNAKTGQSSSYDRHVWMDGSGRLNFGTWLGWAATLSSSASYNDDEWHQVTATLGEAGMNLYVDGLRVAERTDVAGGQDYSGVWRIGGDNMSGWPNQPVSANFNGIIDEVAIFESQIDASSVLNLFQASGRTADIPEVPTDAYGVGVYADEPELFWRFDETEGTVARDTTMAKNDGTINGQVGYASDPAIDHGKSLDFGNENAVVVANRAQNNPSVFSTEAWFKTTTAVGGKIVGFGNAASGLSSSYDRHVYMRNDGSLVFGVYTGAENIAASPKSYNDGEWHHVVSTMSGDGMRLYVDGALVDSNPQTAAQSFNGYWRVGGDRVWGGASSPWFDGQIDEVAVYSRALTQEEVNDHYSVVGAANQNPVAGFNTTSEGLNVAFDASESVDADGSIVDYAWDFGDGSSDNTSTEGITHVYADPGTYAVKLTVTDDRGGKNTVTKDIVVKAVNQLPVAEFSSEQSGLRVSFDGSGSADADGQIAGYEWNFGDDSPTASGKNIDHLYAADGEYTVTLTVTDDDGETAEIQRTLLVANGVPQAAFSLAADGLVLEVDGTDSSDPEGEELEYAWDFGDSGTATGAEATHEYSESGSYEISLTVTDVNGASDTATKTATVRMPNAAPIAAFDSTVDGLESSFDASGSVDTDGTIESYAWDFGDGNGGTGETVTHEYATSGTYEVVLTVTDNGDAKAQATAQITVQDPADLDPRAAFTISSDQLVINVDASSSQPPVAGGEITGYSWDFGDGNNAEGTTATHEYAQAGTYSVTLTVKAGEYLNTISQVVTVAAAQGPVPEFTTSTSGRSLNVDASGTVPGDAAVTAYAWDFGDGKTGSGVTAEHRYAADGKFTVTVTATDGNGLSASTSTEIMVENTVPVAAFTLATSELEIQVDATASNDVDGSIESYDWKFGDGGVASGKTASHAYAEAGQYEVTLVVTDNDAATAELVQTVEVTAATEPKVLVRDQFERNQNNGWGSAEQGGAWLNVGSNSNFRVNGTTGQIRMSNPGNGPLAYLPAQIREADLTVKLSRDKAATGGGIYQTVTIRDIPGVGSYRLKVRILSNQNVAATLERVLGGAVTAMTAETVIGQVEGSPSSPLLLRLQATGVDTTTLRAKLYNAGGIEPADWQLSATDSAVALQAKGRIGLSVYLSGSATNAPVWGGFDELLVTEVE